MWVAKCPHRLDTWRSGRQVNGRQTGCGLNIVLQWRVSKSLTCRWIGRSSRRIWKHWLSFHFYECKYAYIIYMLCILYIAFNNKNREKLNQKSKQNFIEKLNKYQIEYIDSAGMEHYSLASTVCPKSKNKIIKNKNNCTTIEQNRSNRMTDLFGAVLRLTCTKHILIIITLSCRYTYLIFYANAMTI